jgi:hypothetical protein
MRGHSVARDRNVPSLGESGRAVSWSGMGGFRRETYAE